MLPEGEGKRVRIIRVSRELLRDALHLPDGTEIVDVSAHLYFSTDELAIKVEHPEFTPVLDGHAIPVIMPLLGEKRGVTFLGWRE